MTNISFGKPILRLQLNYLDTSIRGIKLQKKQIPNSKKIKYDASIRELNPKRLKFAIGTY